MNQRTGAADSLPDDSTPTGSPMASQPTLLAPIARLLLTPSEAAAALRISPRLLWSKTKAGEIPCIRIGKAVRYAPSALQEWIDSVKSEE
jgi:excisionase family DNA binding protein